jgi:hypothetical protein
MSSVLDRPREDLEAALRSDRPKLALRSAIQQLVERGYSRQNLLEILEEVRERLRLEGKEDAEDVVLDVMDALDGWVAPHAVI